MTDDLLRLCAIRREELRRQTRIQWACVAIAAFLVLVAMPWAVRL